jgi:hypothetical protein
LNGSGDATNLIAAGLARGNSYVLSRFSIICL